MLAPMNKAQAEGAPSAEDLAALEREAGTCGSAVKEAKQRTKESGSEEDRHKVGNCVGWALPLPLDLLGGTDGSLPCAQAMLSTETVAAIRTSTDGALCLLQKALDR